MSLSESYFKLPLSPKTLDQAAQLILYAKLRACERERDHQYDAVPNNKKSRQLQHMMPASVAKLTSFRDLSRKESLHLSSCRLMSHPDFSIISVSSRQLLLSRLTNRSL